MAVKNPIKVPFDTKKSKLANFENQNAVNSEG
jgi:hypothetical protein